MKALFALTLLVLSTLAQAGQLLDIRIIDRSTGRALDTWRHQGKIYVVGAPGKRYAVQLNNRSSGRLLSVISVDGVNAVSGETAATGQAGYVLTAGQRADIAGWRKNMDEVAAFYFTSVSDSYAGRTGRPQHTGVIGVAVFREWEPPRISLPLAAPEPTSAAEAGSRDAAAPRAEMNRQQASKTARLGTGHGERLQARTENTVFRRVSEQPDEIIRIYYDSRPNLIARGIIPRPQHRLPEAFPGGFVPDPQG